MTTGNPTFPSSQEKNPNTLKDKMSSIDLSEYYTKNENNLEWLGVLRKFPELLQREIVVERPDGDASDIEEIGSWTLIEQNPVEVPIAELLQNEENIKSITRQPQKIIDLINEKWGFDLETSKVFDPNPERVFEYAKLSPDTAKPSIMANGEIV